MVAAYSKHRLHGWNALWSHYDWHTIRHVIQMINFLISTNKICLNYISIGRRKAFLINVIMMAFVVTGTAFSPDVITFTVLRFLSGIGGIANFDVVFVWGNKQHKSYFICIFKLK